MILVDTSVWVDHLRRSDPALVKVLNAGLAMTHPFVIGELACGNLRNRDVVLTLLQDLPAAPVATDDEILAFIDRRNLAGTGIGYVDAHILSAVALAGKAEIWSRDKRLVAVAVELGVACGPARAGSAK